MEFDVLGCRAKGAGRWEGGEGWRVRSDFGLTVAGAEAGRTGRRPVTVQPEMRGRDRGWEKPLRVWIEVGGGAGRRGEGERRSTGSVLFLFLHLEDGRALSWDGEGGESGFGRLWSGGRPQAGRQAGRGARDPKLGIAQNAMWVGVRTQQTRAPGELGWMLI